MTSYYSWEENLNVTLQVVKRYILKKHPLDYRVFFFFQVTERALFHVDNCYNIPNTRATGYMCETNIPSNTAFRGFGGPQVQIFSVRKLNNRGGCVTLVSVSLFVCSPLHGHKHCWLSFISGHDDDWVMDHRRCPHVWHFTEAGVVR